MRRKAAAASRIIEPMRIGVVFPQTEIGADPTAVKDYAQAVEEMGYEHLLVYDHVLGANAGSRPDWSGSYRHTDMFHEPMVLFGYLAGLTQRIELVTGILISPQRQTALIAKQAAEVDVLTRGRLRLGIGTGWNHVEYEALREDFTNRGLRSEEQIEIMRALWTRELVTYKGQWHKITDAGLNPLPVQRPIPIWFGGTHDRVLRRIARIGDGWFPQHGPGNELDEMLAALHRYAREAGRDPAEIGLDGRLSATQGGPDSWAEGLAQWKAVGATHVSVNTMGAGLSSPSGHIDALRRFKDAADGWARQAE